MKKLVAGLFTAMALTLGLVSVSGTAPAAATTYVVQPAQSVTAGVAGHTIIVKIDSGVVGLKPSGTLTWTWVKYPSGLRKSKARAHHKQFTDGLVRVNLRGKAFPVPGTYKIKISIGGHSKIVKIVVK